MCDEPTDTSPFHYIEDHPICRDLEIGGGSGDLYEIQSDTDIYRLAMFNICTL